MNPIDRIFEFLQRLSPLSRSCLLNELERLEGSGVDLPGSADIQAKLRAEFRQDGSTNSRTTNPPRYFFDPLEPLLVEGAPEHANFGRIPRSLLTPIWEWISRDLLPTMTRDYVKAINDLAASENQREIRKAASNFQTKVVKTLENTFKSPNPAQLIQGKLGAYTASTSVTEDVAKIMRALRAREALAKFDAALPARIDKFDDARVAKVTALLDAFGKQNADAVPFALTLVANRLQTAWELVRLATKGAATKHAPDVAKTPYAIAVPMVLDRLDDKRLALRVALRNDRVLIAKDLITGIYDTEYSLRVRIDELDESEWGIRLRGQMEAIAALIDAEVARFPPDVGHVFASRRLRRHDTLAARLTYFAWKGRDAVNNALRLAKG
jgi:hypothetical protein